MMSLLLTILTYLSVGFIEWWIALRRTLACTKGETILLVTLVFAENLLGLFVLSSFIRDNDFTIAIAYSFGSALGSLMVSKNINFKQIIEKTMSKIKCFFHIFRPKNNPKVDGMGDCSKCLPNEEENKKCKNYQPTKIEESD